MHEDLTVSEVLKDPLIRLVNKADGVKLSDFAALLERAAAKRNQSFRHRAGKVISVEATP
jgi:hypothetical protein